MSDRPILEDVVRCLSEMPAEPPVLRAAAVARGWRWAHVAGRTDLARDLARMWLFAVHRRGAPKLGPEAVWQVACEAPHG